MSNETRLANLFGAAMLTAGDIVGPAIEASLGQRGAAAAALVHLADYPGESVEQLFRVLRISQPGAVSVVDRLAAAGLLERQAGKDRRTIALFLTTTGKTEVSKLLRQRAKALETLLSPLCEQERRDLTPLLEKIVAGLAQDRPQARTVCRLCDRRSCCRGPGCPLQHTVGTPAR